MAGSVGHIIVPVAARLAANSVPESNTGCVLWLGSVDRRGYGRMSANGRLTRTHRLAWAETFGPIPSDKWVLHKCDQPSCIRPDHLFLGTHADNMADMARKGRANGGAHNAKKTHCPAGHPLSGDNLRVGRTQPISYRVCLTCHRTNRRKRDAAMTSAERDANNARQRAYGKAWRAKRREAK